MVLERSQNQNFWSSYKNPRWAWNALFDYTCTEAVQLLWWASEALIALYETGIYKVFAVKELGFSSPTADPRRLAAAIGDRYRNDGMVDLLYFSGMIYAGHPHSEIASSLGYFNENNEVAVEDCRDLAELQLKTQPWLQEDSDAVYHRKPIVISGALYAAGLPKVPMENVAPALKSVWVRIETYTDIWAPTVVGFNEADFDAEAKFPNQELAALNGSRLNEAIRRLREITASIGGTWKVDEGFAGQVGEFDESGVVIDQADFGREVRR